MKNLLLFYKTVFVCFTIELVYWHSEVIYLLERGKLGGFLMLVVPVALVSFFSYISVATLKNYWQVRFLSMDWFFVLCSTSISIFVLHVIWYFLTKYATMT